MNTYFEIKQNLFICYWIHFVKRLSQHFKLPQKIFGVDPKNTSLEHFPPRHLTHIFPPKNVLKLGNRKSLGTRSSEYGGCEIKVNFSFCSVLTPYMCEPERYFGETGLFF